MWKLFKGVYEASEGGEIRNSETGTILKPRQDKYGYLLVTLWIEKKPVTFKVHRIIAQTFLENPEEKEQVNHKDGNKQNNLITNLEWSTPKENLVHASKNNLLAKGEEHYEAVLNEDNVQEIRFLIAEGYGNSYIAEKFGVTSGAVYSIRINKSWKHLPWPFPYKFYKATKETKKLGSQRKEAKLTEELVREIKILLKEGVSISYLQKNFGMSGGALRCIRAGTTWKHVIV